MPYQGLWRRRWRDYPLGDKTTARLWGGPNLFPGRRQEHGAPGHDQRYAEKDG